MECLYDWVCDLIGMTRDRNRHLKMGDRLERSAHDTKDVKKTARLRSTRAPQGELEMEVVTYVVNGSSWDGERAAKACLLEEVSRRKRQKRLLAVKKPQSPAT
jgi:hypothetical protein